MSRAYANPAQRVQTVLRLIMALLVVVLMSFMTVRLVLQGVRGELVIPVSLALMAAWAVRDSYRKFRIAGARVPAPRSQFDIE